jgi:hypothetical protein
MSTNTTEEEDRPRFEVWNHLHSGLELARMEFDVFEPETRAKLEEFAGTVLKRRKAFALGIDQQTWLEIYDLLLKDPWFRHAVEIELGREGVGRASGALQRFFDLKPILTKYEISHQSERYFGEVINTYLFGFDVACIALSGAALEKILQEAVVKAGFASVSQSQKIPASELLRKLTKERIICTSRSSAKAVLGERNRILHRDIRDEIELRDLAIQSIRGVGEVVLELGRAAG